MENNSDLTFLGTPSDINHRHSYKSNFKSKATRFNFHITNIIKHIQQLDSGLHNHLSKPLIVFDYYLIMNECNSLESYLKIIQKQLIRLLAKYHKYSNVPGLDKAPIMEQMLDNHFDASSIILHTTFKQSYLYDGAHMKKFIMNAIGKAKLKYHTKKQLHKINDLNQLYKIQIHNHNGIITVATSQEIKHVMNLIKNQLQSLHKTLHVN